MSDVIRLPKSSSQSRNWSTEIHTELLRKSLHLLISMVPSMARWNFGFTVALLASGILVYAYSEYLRLQGFEVVIISKITSMAARRRDAGRFVMGPVTLGLGALLALVLYPEPAASIAIYALAFGDGLSSLVGKSFGNIRLPFTGGKSLEGSLTCLIAVFCSAYALSRNAWRSFLIALIATIIEAFPTKDADNLLLPSLVGLFAVYLFP